MDSENNTMYGMDEEFVKKLYSNNIKCGGCSQHYEPANIDVLGHRKDLWFLFAYCPSCKIKNLVLVVIEGSEVPEVVTDSTEAEKSKSSTPVSSDDVVEMHTFLKDFNGDFSSIL